MNNLIKKSVLVIAIISTSFGIYAQKSESKQNKTEFSIEIDPATFGFKGYGIHLRIKPKNSDHLLIGFGAYSMDFPSLLVDMNKNNRDKGWSVRLNQGFGLFGEYHFSEVNKKWFIGGQLAIQEYKIEKESFNGNEKFTNSVLMAYGGYTWQPFGFGFYIKPWAGIGYTSKISGTNYLDNSEYDIASIMMFATLHLGYTF